MNQVLDQTRVRLDPVFLIGYSRSGTTMLQKMLNAHPAISMPPEGEYFLNLPRILGGGVHQSKDADKVVELVDTMPKGFFRGKLDRPGFRRLLMECLPAPTPVVIAAIYQQWAHQENKGQARWGDKKPQHWPLVYRLRQWYREGQFLHLVRDPRDVAASMVTNFPDNLSFDRLVAPHLAYAWHWKTAYWESLKQGKILGDRYFGLRYEELVADPRKNLERICQFLDLEFDEGMLSFHQAKSAIGPIRQDGARQHRETKDPAHKENIGRHLKRLTAEQIRDIEYVCRREMAKLGYQPAMGGISALRKAHINALVLACAGAWKGARAFKRLMGGL